MKKTLLIILAAALIPWGPLRAADGPGAPSRGGAFALSLLLPGAGEFYAGSRTSGWVFLGTECALWGLFAGLEGYSGSRLDDCRLTAAGHAGVNPAGKGRDFLVALENYMTLAEYNEAKLRQRDLAALYPEGGAWDWRWDSPSARRRYEHMRISADRAARGALFTAGGIALNHIVSGIDAIRAARKAEAAAEKRSEVRTAAPWRLSMAPLPGGGGVVGLSMRF
jgi:hypothetical protein